MSDKYEAIVTAEMVQAAFDAGDAELAKRIPGNPHAMEYDEDERAAMRAGIIATGLPAEIARLRAEVERLRRDALCTVWAIAKTAGGECRYTQHAMLEALGDKMKLVRQEDWDTNSVVFTALTMDRDHD